MLDELLNNLRTLKSYRSTIAHLRDKYSSYYTEGESSYIDGWITGVDACLSKGIEILGYLGLDEEASELGLWWVGPAIIGAIAVAGYSVYELAGVVKDYMAHKDRVLDAALKGETRALEEYRDATQPGTAATAAAGFGLGTLAAGAALVYWLWKKRE